MRHKFYNLIVVQIDVGVIQAEGRACWGRPDDTALWSLLLDIFGDQAGDALIFSWAKTSLALEQARASYNTPLFDGQVGIMHVQGLVYSKWRELNVY